MINNGETEEQKEHRKKCREKLQGLIESIGEWNINCLALAKEWRLAERTINNWKHKIVEKIGPVDFTKCRSEIEKGFVSNIKYCQKLIKTAKNERNRISAVNAYNSSIKTFVEYQEAYGVKPKVPDPIDIRGQVKELSLKEDFAEFKKIYDGNKKEE